MVRSVLICSTAWKSSLTPDEANRFIASALAEVRPDWDVTCLPLADGGDGWLECLLSLPGMSLQTCCVTGPLFGQQVEARYLYDPANQWLFLESAEIHGMRRLPEGTLQGLQATSYGVGEAMVTRLQRHPETREVVVSVGGSASTDGGLGFLQALGWRFFDASGQLIPLGLGAAQFVEITGVEAPSVLPVWPKVTLLTDVETVYADSPSLFGPQKGVPMDWISPLSEAFQRVASLIDPSGERQVRAGSGAAGGLPFGVLTAISKARMTSGVVWTAEHLGFQQALSAADAVITGEGRFDETSLLGKVTGYVLEEAQKQGKPVLILCGQSPFPQDFKAGVRIQPLYEASASITASDFEQTPEKIKSALLAGLSAIG